MHFLCSHYDKLTFTHSLEVIMVISYTTLFISTKAGIQLWIKFIMAQTEEDEDFVSLFFVGVFHMRATRRDSSHRSSLT